MTDQPEDSEIVLPKHDQSDSVKLPTDSEIFTRLDNLWSPPADALATSLKGRTVGLNDRYQIIREIGRGGFGVVYQAYDSGLKRDVALKLPRPEVILDEEKLRRFEAEATTAAALHHPGIVPIYEADLHASPPYIVSYYCSGPDLAKWLEECRSPISAEFAAEFIVKTTVAVQYIHSQGVLHRDLKPANIMLEAISVKDDETEMTLNDFVPRLTDFGLSKIVENSMQQTRSSLLIGTPVYMAPEQLEKNTQDPTEQTDVYAIGVVLFELLTLRTPFEGTTYIEVVDQVRSIEPKQLRSINKDVPADLETICQKALVKDPLERYRTAEELKQDLQRFLAGESIQARPDNWLIRFLRWCKKPERLYYAGKFAFWFQMLVIIWMIFQSIALLFVDNYTPELLRNNTIGTIIVILFFHLPQAVLGWLTARKKRWAFWVTLILSIVTSWSVLYSMLFTSIAFEYNYADLQAKLGVFMGLILGHFVQTALFFLAIPAWFRLRK